MVRFCRLMDGLYHVLLLFFRRGDEVCRHGHRGQAGLHHFGKEFLPKRLGLFTRWVVLEGLQGFIHLELILGGSGLLTGTAVVRHHLREGLRQFGLYLELLLHHPGKLEAHLMAEHR